MVDEKDLKAVRSVRPVEAVRSVLPVKPVVPVRANGLNGLNRHNGLNGLNRHNRLMRWRTTLILFLATIGIGAYVSLRELKQPTREDRALLADQVMSVAPDTVTQLILKNSKGTVTIEHADRGWRLAPQQLRADESRVSGVLDQLSPLTAERILAGTPEKPLDYAAFGLAPEQGSVTVVANGRLTTLLFGHVTPVGQLRYAKLADHPQVYLVPASSYDEWDVPLEQLRDSSLMPMRGWTVESLAVQAAPMPFSLAYHDDAWWVAAPFQDRADRTEVSALVNRVNSLRIDRVVEDAPQVEHVAEWGLDHPKAELVVGLKDLPAPITIVFGAPVPDAAGMVYAKRSDEPALYAVAASDVDALLLDPHSLRSKACFEFFTGQVSKVALQRGDAGWTAVKQNGQWKADPGELPLDTERVESFLNTAADLRVDGFEAAPGDLAGYGLNPPEGRLAIWTTGKETPQRVLIGAAAPKTENRYGQIEGRPAIVRLPEAVTTLLETTLEALRPDDTNVEDADAR